MLAHTEVSLGRGEQHALQLLSLSEVWLPTSELELQVTLISKIFHFPCIVALQNGSSSWEWRWKATDFFRAKGKPHQNHITDCYDGAPTVAWTLSFILLQEKSTGSDLLCWCHLHQLPGRSCCWRFGHSYHASLCVTEAKRLFQAHIPLLLRVPKVWKTANPDPKLGTLWSSFNVGGWK